MKRLILAALLFTGCVTGSDETAETLGKAGFTNIRPGSLNFFACGEHDKTGRNFQAKNATGQQVEGVVCCGVFKSCTVRF